MRDVALIEYQGFQPKEGQVYGCAKGLANPYTRTDPNIMDKIRQEVKHEPPKKKKKKKKKTSKAYRL